MAVQVNQRARFVDYSVLSCIILYVDGNSLLRNDECYCIDILKFHSCMLVIAMN